MRRWWIPAVAILGFFVLMSAVLKSIAPSPSLKPISNSKIESALNNMMGSADKTRIKFENKIATKGEKVPSWGGGLAKSIVPQMESLTFKAPQKVVAKVDPKKDTKKKKEAAKKKKKTTEVAKRKTKPSQSKPFEAVSSDNSDYADGGTSVAPKKQKDPNALPETLEEWESLVLNPPTIDAVMTLIKYHQAKLVSDEIFYKITETLIRSSNEQTRKFGIIALGSSPSLQSFILLTYASEVEKSSALQTMISSNYNTYVSLQYLSVLGPAMQSPDANVRLQAISSLSHSASLNIKKSNEVMSGRGRVSSNSSAQYYQGFLAVLQNLANNDPNGDVRTQAGAAYNQISGLTSTDVVAFN